GQDTSISPWHAQGLYKKNRSVQAVPFLSPFLSLFVRYSSRWKILGHFSHSTSWCGSCSCARLRSLSTVPLCGIWPFGYNSAHADQRNRDNSTIRFVQPHHSNEPR